MSPSLTPIQGAVAFVLAAAVLSGLYWIVQRMLTYRDPDCPHAHPHGDVPRQEER